MHIRSPFPCIISHPESPRVTQSHPESPRVAQSCPESPMARVMHPESPRVTQSHPESPRVIPSHPESPRVTQSHPVTHPVAILKGSPILSKIVCGFWNLKDFTRFIGFHWISGFDRIPNGYLLNGSFKYVTVTAYKRSSAILQWCHQDITKMEP